MCAVSQGYWRPSTLFKSDKRYEEDFEVIVACPHDKVVQDEQATWGAWARHSTITEH